MLPRAERAPVSPVSPLGFCGQKPRWAAVSGDGLQAFAMRVRLCLPPLIIKIIYEGGMQSLSRTTLERLQKGKFWVGAKFYQ